MKPRTYQVEVVDAVIDFLFKDTGNGVIASPTGTGKTVEFNYLLLRLKELAPDMRAMVVTHDQRIIGQNASSMQRVAPKLSIGIYSSGLKLRETYCDITFAGIQSVFKRPEEFGRIDILIIDEAHCVSPKDNTMYQKFVRGLKQVNPDLRIIGFSGTPYRLGQGLITEGELFNKIILDHTKTDKFNWFVTEGYLCRLVTKPTATSIDVTNVAMKGGDFDEHELQAVSDTDELNLAIVNECLTHGKERNHWLGFSTGVKHAERLADVFKKKGVTCEIIHAKTPEGVEGIPGTKDDLLARFKSGKIRCLINVGMLTTGYDFPSLDMIFVARATQSTGLWVQILGRGTRACYAKGLPLNTAEERLAAIALSEKKNCLVLDFAQNTIRLGPINDPLVPLPRKKGAPIQGEAPVKECPECGAYNHTRAVFCVECGFEFPPPSTVKGTAGNQEVMTDLPVQDQIFDFDVNHIIYQPHTTKAGNPAVEITYLSGVTRFKKYLIFSNEPSLQNRLVAWWKHHKGKSPVPKKPAEFVAREAELQYPKTVRVITNRKYPEVIGTSFDDHEPEETN